MNYPMRQSVITAMLIISFTASPSAQTLSGTKEAPTRSMVPTSYALSEQGGLMISVDLWGFVGNPGRYRVLSPTSVVQLISLAGGPAEDAELDKVEIVRQTMLPDSTLKSEIIPVNLEEFKAKGGQTPLLAPGDTIIVPGSTKNSWQLVLAILGPLFSLVTAVGTLILILRR